MQFCRNSHEIHETKYLLWCLIIVTALNVHNYRSNNIFYLLTKVDSSSKENLQLPSWCYIINLHYRKYTVLIFFPQANLKEYRVTTQNDCPIYKNRTKANSKAWDTQKYEITGISGHFFFKRKVKGMEK